jgi:hypothetical protein
VQHVDLPEKEARSSSRRSAEERFLEHAVRLRPRQRIPIDMESPHSEARRILGELRDLFQKMKGLAAEFRSSDRVRYASEMESLKERLVVLLDAAKRIVREVHGGQELFEMIRTETDSELKERLAILFRYAHRETLGPFLVNLVNSQSAVDRRIAIDGLAEVRTVESVGALSRRADADREMTLRQRAIIGLGKTLGKPSRQVAKYKETALGVIRKYAQSDNLPALRAAAFEAFRFPVFLSKEDRDLITTAYSTDPQGSAVYAAIQNAYSDMAHGRSHRTDSGKR